jgi:cytochrome c556
MKSKLMIGLLAGTTMAAAAFAHGGAEGVVKERMDGMMAMGQSVKELAPMMRGEITYDAEAVRTGARVFVEHSEGMTELFPEGSAGNSVRSQSSSRWLAKVLPRPPTTGLWRQVREWMQAP